MTNIMVRELISLLMAEYGEDNGEMRTGSMAENMQQESIKARQW